ncbi:MAG: ubiquinone/menaquinone biosynthesis methyltransferase [Pontiellaceae bacterium]|nr:ubiquinone/menaquinone biosynthesis methyltransferase [Pontiellaceae bacterium]
MSSDRDTLISADENRAMFDRIAKNYDAANRAISLGMDRKWRRTAVGVLGPVAGGCYLDVGTGTGDLVLELLEQSASVQVDGIDLSEGMLDIAKTKASEKGVGDAVSFFQADATALPMRDACYDGIISGFCFRNIERRRKALTEMHRVLKPGGRLVVLEAVYPQRSWVRFGYKLYTSFIPLMGALFGSFSAFRYLKDSIEDFPQSEQVVEMFRETGFVRVERCPLLLGAICIFSAERTF